MPRQRQSEHVARPTQSMLPGLDDLADEAEWTGPEGLAALIARGSEFNADALRRIAGVPTSRNRIGALFLTAAARGDIVPVGITRSTSRSRHAGKLTIWRAAA